MSLLNSHQRLIDITKPLLRVGDSVIPPSASVRNLHAMGAILDAQMIMCQRVTSIVRSVSAHPRSLRRVRRYLNATTAAAAARTLILSLLDYANALLAGLSIKLTNRIQVVQNNAARLVARTSPRSHITPVPQELHWLPVRLRVFHKVMCLAYKAHSSTAPAYLSDLIPRRQRTRSLRSSTDGSLLTVLRTRKPVW